MPKPSASMRIEWLAACAAFLTACGGGGSGSGDSEGTGGWTEPPGVPAVMAMLDVWAFSTTDVWFVDGSPSIHRFDGTSWTQLETGAAAGVSCIFALSPSDVFLCSGDGVLHYDGAVFAPLVDGANAGIDGVADVWATGPSDVWAVGGSAIVAHFDGVGWSGTVAGSPFKTSIWGSSASDIYALDTFDLVHYDGSTWSDVPLDSGGGEGQVWGTSASDVWVMTDSYDLSHFDGTTWKTVETDLTGDLACVWGPAANDLWAAGSAGEIAHWDGAGWKEVTHQRIGAPYLQQFVAIHGSGSNDVWAVGRQLGEQGSVGLVRHRRR